MTRLPPDILRALRSDDGAPADPERLARLAGSIESAAAPLLALRRRAEPAWWELPSAWAATLIPASLVLALASILVLWRVQPPRAVEEVAQATVDQVVNELVTTPPR
jgi:hypothetical protein